LNSPKKGRRGGGRREDHAKRRASWLAEKCIGVVAFSQMVDKEGADAEEPVLLAYHGRVPPEAKAAA